MSTTTSPHRRRRQYAIFTKKGRSWEQYSERTFAKAEAHERFSGIVARMVSSGTQAEIRPIDNPSLGPKKRYVVVQDPTRPEPNQYTVVQVKFVVVLDQIWTDKDSAELLATAKNE